MSEDSNPVSDSSSGGTGPSLLKLLFKKATIPVAVAILTLVGQYFISKKLQERIAPSLVKDVYSPDLSTLPPEIQKQIPLIPVRYSLRHFAGGPAHNITIFAKGTSAISASDFRFAPDSEGHTEVQTDTNSVTVNVPQIRSSGFVNFDLMKAVSNNVTFTERSEDAVILSPSAAEQRKQRNILYINLGIGALVVAWITIVSLAVAFVWRFKRWFTEYEADGREDLFRKRILLFVVVIISYNLLVASLGILAGFLPIPRLSTGEITDGVILYLVLTRYKLIVNWLSSHTKSKSGETHEKPPGA